MRPFCFEIEKARVDGLSARPVVIVEGRWRASALHYLGVYIDAEGDGRIVQEIYFEAPEDDFRAQLPVIEDCLCRIDWAA